MSTQTSAQPRTNDTMGISKVLLPPGTLERVAAVLASGHLAQGAEVEHLEAEAARMSRFAREGHDEDFGRGSFGWDPGRNGDPRRGLASSRSNDGIGRDHPWPFTIGSASTP